MYPRWVSIIFDILPFLYFRAILLKTSVLGPALDRLTISTLEEKAVKHFMFATRLVNKRLSYTDYNKSDLWSFILEHKEHGRSLTRNEMQANASMFMVPGTETTATNLSSVIHHLCQYSQVYKQLVEEIRATFKSSSEIAVGPLNEVEYLNAVLRKGLRIYVPGGGRITRIVHPRGAEICGEYVPGRIYVNMNHYSAHLNQLNFSDPKEFIPERWIGTDDPWFASDRRDVHEPFHMGL